MITLEGVSKVYRKRGRPFFAVKDVSLEIGEDSNLVLVGESGSGKTTLGKIIAGLLRPSSGRVLYRGRDIWSMGKTEYREYRLSVQMIHQDPYSALNPMRKIYHALASVFEYHGLTSSRSETRDRVMELLEMVGLTPPDEIADRYPHQLSGGQLQRVTIARAVILRPRLIVADEAVSMLDPSLRVSLIDLMVDLQRKYGMSYVFITHDLACARYFALKSPKGSLTAVMKDGEVVEKGDLERILRSPRHPYTRALVEAAPRLR